MRARALLPLASYNPFVTIPAVDTKMYKIGEVCRQADVQPYVLRYWETEFPALAPNKSGGGQRMYSRREIDVILRIKELLYTEGFTIAGAKKKLDLELVDGVLRVAPETAIAEPATEYAARSSVDLSSVKKELTDILDLLRRDPA